jgi:hypothetical protein
MHYGVLIFIVKLISCIMSVTQCVSLSYCQDLLVTNEWHTPTHNISTLLQLISKRFLFHSGSMTWETCLNSQAKWHLDEHSKNTWAFYGIPSNSVTSTLRPLAIHFKLSLSSFIEIPDHHSSTNTLHHILLHKEHDMVSDLQYDTLKQTKYIVLSLIFSHFYCSSTAHTNCVTEKRLNLIILIAIQCTCFPFTNTVVMKGLMLSTVWWSRLLQYRTATQ